MRYEEARFAQTVRVLRGEHQGKLAFVEHGSSDMPGGIVITIAGLERYIHIPCADVELVCDRGGSKAHDRR